MRPSFAATAVAIAVAVVALANPEAGSASLRLGFTDRDAFQTGSANRAIALARVKAGRGSIVRLVAGWREIERQPPPDAATARNPFWAGYNWDSLDSEVRDVVAAGLVPLINLSGAPRWAEGPNRPPVSPRAPVGTWRPSPAAFRSFAEAIARRYSGTVAGLPQVRYLEGWNEPNLGTFLTPQWERRRGRWVPASPAHYRRLLNAFYAGVKAGNRRARVVTAGFVPFGDPRPGQFRIMPARFVRDWLCVTGGRRPRARRCPGGPARFDIFAHHPYSVGGPTRRALNDDDVTIPDLRKLTRSLSTAIRSRRVFPARRKQIWITELSWDSRPPDPDGVPAGTHGRWLAGAFYQLWRQGADAVVWFNLRDQAPGRGYPFTLQSGVFLAGPTIGQDRPKPAWQAFRFPFTAYHSRGRARLWGLAPQRGTVRIEVRRGGWRRLATLRAGRSRIFARSLRLRKGALLRARQGTEASLSWRVR